MRTLIVPLVLAITLMSPLISCAPSNKPDVYIKALQGAHNDMKVGEVSFGLMNNVVSKLKLLCKIAMAL